MPKGWAENPSHRHLDRNSFDTLKSGDLSYAGSVHEPRKKSDHDGVIGKPERERIDGRWSKDVDDRDPSRVTSSARVFV